MKLYELGNCLRGYFRGEFPDIDTAWRVLSCRFLKSFPSKSGRMVQMYCKQPNEFGLEQFVLCKNEFTSLEPATEEEMKDIL